MLSTLTASPSTRLRRARVTLSCRSGAVPRVCIGASFATIEAAVILAVLIRAFRFLPVAGHKPKPVARVTLRPAGGMPLLIAARANQPVAERAFSKARKAS